MKKFVVSALCALCLMGAFAYTAQDATKPTDEVAISRYAIRSRWM